MAESAETSSSQAAEKSQGQKGPTMNDKPGLLFFETDLEVDSFGDHDSALGDGMSSVTTSLSPSVLDYETYRGRRYHAYREGKYVLPNDDDEINRLNLQHQIWDIAMNGKLYLSPLPNNITDAVDLGCGTGSWAIDFAETHPHCQTLGTDLSPIQPTDVPINCRFMVDDVTAEWAFGHSFDFIHTRAITAGLSDWDHLLAQCYANLRPGGWLELQELRFPLECDDGSLPADSALKRWGDGLMESMTKLGIDGNASFKHVERLQKAGFKEVNQVHGKWAVGPWPRGEKEKRIGAMFLRDLTGNLYGVSLKMFTQLLGWSEETLKGFVEEVQRDMENPNIHTFMPVDIFWAQKPEEPTEAAPEGK
ncbi:S-adenosyl-L-methionine-dependent methyltransferase [Aulographum hederae CBS 113979]|uniref:S-adenosyl-L-methionine-dependent methyltransferase n=1 Tax=Aulographum hederae CBS 113979 TaxID=1176131 RepID=A0A6G1HB82_9PEZI|nr:S-adenosyl-L-methionine-dependent methyltransferase [Aulographum hederae CBS 113979]